MSDIVQAMRIQLAKEDSLHDIWDHRCHKDNRPDIKDILSIIKQSSSYTTLSQNGTFSELPYEHIEQFIINNDIDIRMSGMTNEEKCFAIVSYIMNMKPDEDYIEYDFSEFQEEAANRERTIQSFKEKLVRYVFEIDNSEQSLNGKILHIVYDQFPVSLLDDIKDSVEDLTKEETNALIIDTACLATYHDPASRASTNKLHISVNINPTEHIVKIPFCDVDFYLQSDITNLISMNQNKVNILAKESNQTVSEDTPGVFTESELILKPFNVGIGNLCVAYKNAKDPKEIVDILMESDKSTPVIKSPFFYKKCLKTFGNLFRNKSEIFHIKRSGDFGQVSMVSVLNNIVCTIFPKFAITEKKVHINGNLLKGYSNTTKKFVLMTGDEICAANAILNQIPIIYYKKKLNKLYVYKGVTAGATSKISQPLLLKLEYFKRTIVDKLLTIDVDTIPDTQVISEEEDMPEGQRINDNAESVIDTATSKLFNAINNLKYYLKSKSKEIHQIKKEYTTFNNAYAAFMRSRMSRHEQGISATSIKGESSLREGLNDDVPLAEVPDVESQINNTFDLIYKKNALTEDIDFDFLLLLLSVNTETVDKSLLSRFGIRFPVESGLHMFDSVDKMFFDEASKTIFREKVMIENKGSYNIDTMTLGKLLVELRNEKRTLSQRQKMLRETSINEISAALNERYVEYVKDVLNQIKDTLTNVRNLHASLSKYFEPEQSIRNATTDEDESVVGDNINNEVYRDSDMDGVASQMLGGGTHKYLDLFYLLRNSESLMKCKYLDFQVLCDKLQVVFDDTILQIWDLLDQQRNENPDEQLDDQMSDGDEDGEAAAAAKLKRLRGTFSQLEDFYEFKKKYFYNKFAQLYILARVTVFINLHIKPEQSVSNLDVKSMLSVLTKAVIDAVNILATVYRLPIPSTLDSSMTDLKNMIKIITDNIKFLSFEDKDFEVLKCDDPPQGNAISQDTAVYQPTIDEDEEITSSSIQRPYAASTTPIISSTPSTPMSIDASTPDEKYDEIYDEYINKLKKEFMNDVKFAFSVYDECPENKRQKKYGGFVMKMQRMTLEDYHKRYYPPYWSLYYH